jgi:hypothetical protein
MRATGLTVFAAAALLLFAACDAEQKPNVEPAGEESTPKEEALKAGAEVLQGNEPTDKLDIYLVGFHPLVDDPAHQMEAHHYCHQVNQDFAQCVIFDSSEENANLNGIEYIISEERFNALPQEEKQYWHPHNYEILSGQLVAPGLPDAAEHELMEGKMNSYGKTWHVWQTGSAVTPGQDFPYGPARLAWSFNADGEAKPGLIESRDKAMEMDTAEIRKKRRDLVEMAEPQRGVDRLAEAFPQREKIEGVEARNAGDAPDASPQ